MACYGLHEAVHNGGNYRRPMAGLGEGVFRGKSGDKFAAYAEVCMVFMPNKEAVSNYV